MNLKNLTYIILSSSLLTSCHSPGYNQSKFNQEIKEFKRNTRETYLMIRGEQTCKEWWHNTKKYFSNKEK